MANSQFQENQFLLNTMFYESHKSVVQRVCMALGHVDKTQEMLDLVLGDKVKIKFLR